MKPDIESPVKLEIEITVKCPLKCLHCSVDSSDKLIANELTLEEIQDILLEFSELGGRRLVITGGEPLYRGRAFLLAVLEMATKLSIETSLYTSGYKCEEEYAKEIVSTGLNEACITIHGTEKTHDKITGIGGSHISAINALTYFRNCGAKTRVHFVPMKPNFNEFEYVTSLCEKLKVDSLKILNFRCQGRARYSKHLLQLSKKDNLKFANNVMDYIGCKNVSIDFGGPFISRKNRCGIGKKIVITSKGDVLPCLGLRDFGMIIGNVRKKQLKILWANLAKSVPKNVCICQELENVNLIEAVAASWP